MTDKLTDAARALLERPVLATVATVAGDGSPQLTPVWVDLDGDDVLFNTAEGRAKARNLARDRRVGVSVIDPEDPYNAVVVKGTATEVTTEGADEHIDRLAKKYLGAESYPMRQPGEVRCIVRRVPPSPGIQAPLFPTFSYHPFITDQPGDLRTLDQFHRDHARVENVIKDLKDAAGLDHLPSGRFGANGAWLVLATIAHNLARWTGRLGLGTGIVTAKTLRRRFFSLPGRITRSARRTALHLPIGWPWADEFLAALARFRALPLLA